ncbi:hypothetical protein CPB83DRAFT_859705 [Crepidotus variabilis]|uniref:Uncharacterized protein n=1 Tax=Crepidotus variabilis TaxID=179855 RepID=A0A9P6JLJ2_9AGAR|nr:hypothetical protein CPB83DRAFT_859705 [Crepidotus variabilis]
MSLLNSNSCKWQVASMEQGVSQLDFLNVDSGVNSSSSCSRRRQYDNYRDANSKAAPSKAYRQAMNIFPSDNLELLRTTLLTWVFWAFKPLISTETLRWKL